MSETTQTTSDAPSYPLDHRTAVLIGRHVARLRAEHEPPVSAGGLATAKRTEEWVLAFESGHLEVNAKMLKAMGSMLVAHGMVVDLETTAVGLQQFAQSPAKRELARSLLEGEPASDRAIGSAPSDPASVLEAITSDDRFLVITPVLLCASLVMLALRLLGWGIDPEGGGEGWPSSMSHLVDDAVLPALLIGAIISALALRWIDQKLVAMCHRLRSAKRHAEHASCNTQIRRQGVTSWTDRKDWRLSELAGQIIPRHRAAVLDTSVRVEFLERIVPATAVGFIATCGCIAGGILASSVLATALTAVYGVTLLLLLVGAYRAADKASEELHTKLALGLGHYDVAVPARTEMPTP